MITDACGIRAWSLLSVAGASGALPIDTAMGAERSAPSNRGLAVISSAIAGTRKIIIGLSPSTTSNQWSTSNFGMYSPVRPIFIGLKMKLMPANVNSGAPCNQPRCDQCGAAFGIIATLRCRTSTPFGRPVVPDVYMMSAMSSSATGTWIALASTPAISASQPSAPSFGAVGAHDRPQRRHLGAHRARVIEQTGAREHHRDLRVPEDRDHFRGRETRVRGDHHRARLVHRRVRDDPPQAVLVRERDRDAVALLHAVVDQPAGGLVRLRVPLREGERGLGVEVDVAGLVGVPLRHVAKLVDEERPVGLVHTHAAATSGPRSPVRRA